MDSNIKDTVKNVYDYRNEIAQIIIRTLGEFLDRSAIGDVVWRGSPVMDAIVRIYKHSDMTKDDTNEHEANHTIREMIRELVYICRATRMRYPDPTVNTHVDVDTSDQCIASRIVVLSYVLRFALDHYTDNGISAMIRNAGVLVALLRLILRCIEEQTYEHSIEYTGLSLAQIVNRLLN